ncbi:glutaredoxin family protein [Paenirhodobacter populi]|uniref:glutaredoxin family protein n=1 Tax=Paenirhodobacter populi TaxID=2306993 RepID=UPI000FE326E4|nr:glutaredoxin family protein [Sinirhodobacter populi]RWR09722.1 glutaredoxin family protein [Sinirhodobacter populi]
MKLLILGNPRCVQCDATVRKAEKLGIPHEYRDVTADPAAMTMAKETGFRQAPVCIVVKDGAPVDRWAGFNPARIEAAARRIAQAQCEACGGSGVTDQSATGPDLCPCVGRDDARG